MNKDIEQNLKNVVATYGLGIIDDPRRCKALMGDFCGKDTNKIRYLSLALDEGVVHKLLSNKHLPAEAAIKNCARMLEDNLGLKEEVAMWAMITWAGALNISNSLNRYAPRETSDGLEKEARRKKQEEAERRGKEEEGRRQREFEEKKKRKEELARQQEARELEKQKLARERQEIENLAALEAERQKLTAERSKLTAGETRRDGQFIAYDNGTVLDTQTKLMWAAKDNGSNINWTNAKSYCEHYRGGGYTDWRMPTLDDLAGLYGTRKAKSRGFFNLTDLIMITNWFVWAVETRGSEAAYLSFLDGIRYWFGRSYDYSGRALPVRSGK